MQTDLVFFRILTWWSYIEHAVLMIGDQKFEVKGNVEMGGPPIYWVDDKPGTDVVGEDESMKALVKEVKRHLPGFGVHYRSPSNKQHYFRIELGDKNAISIETYKDWVSVNVKAVSGFQGTRGLMGSYPSGTKYARDGVTVMEDTDAFGKEWQVLESEPMVFRSRGKVHRPQAECLMPEVPSMSERKKRRLGESLLSEEDALSACENAHEENLDNCIYDVLATNDKDTAGAY